MNKDTIMLLKGLVAGLCKKEQQVIILLYGLNGTKSRIEDVAEITGLTVKAVREIEETVLRKLRNPQPYQCLRCGSFMDFIDCDHSEYKTLHDGYWECPDCKSTMAVAEI